MRGSFGFTINQSGDSYLQYLQTILEDGEAYRQRRKSFLDHLLARFAEVFTDYALLYLGDTKSAAFEQGQIEVIERFLAHYPGLSANRGKAMNYLKPGWVDENISGLERAVQGICGDRRLERHHLCNFEVVQHEATFQLKLMLEGKEWFVSKESFVKEESGEALKALVSGLAGIGNYQVVELPKTGGMLSTFIFIMGALPVRRGVMLHRIRRGLMRWRLAALFSPELRDADIRISRYEYHIALLDSDGRVVRYSKQAYASEKLAQAQTKKSLAKPQDNILWEYDGSGAAIGKLIRNKEKGNQYLDLNGFRIFAKNDLIGRPDRWVSMSWIMTIHFRCTRWKTLLRKKKPGKRVYVSCTVLSSG